MALEDTEYTFRQFATLWNRKPTLTALPGPGETSDPATATLTIVWTNDGTAAGSSFQFNQAVT